MPANSIELTPSAWLRFWLLLSHGVTFVLVLVCLGCGWLHWSLAGTGLLFTLVHFYVSWRRQQDPRRLTHVGFNPTGLWEFAQADGQELKCRLTTKPQLHTSLFLLLHFRDSARQSKRVMICRDSMTLTHYKSIIRKLGDSHDQTIRR
ncbi:MAG: hypothetical protein CMF50_09645 [Legionellales bacterium]|nr:hypothetical protein [Legionellales bacterium]